MKIKVGENTFIESDSMQFMIKKYSGKTYTNDDGKETEGVKTLGYYRSLNNALKDLVRMKLLESNATTIQELLEDVKRIEKEIDELIKV